MFACLSVERPHGQIVRIGSGDTARIKAVGIHVIKPSLEGHVEIHGRRQQEVAFPKFERFIPRKTFEDDGRLLM
jgi:hypothetical protein